MKKLVRDGTHQEFFPEGGRSRTGKLLPAKLGLLAWEVDAVLEGARNDLAFVPVSIDYEVVEGGTYTMTEVRTVLWPKYETPEYSAAEFLQGIAGTLELFHRSTLSFQQIAGEATGHPVAVFQRIDQAGYKLPIDERIQRIPIRCWCSDSTICFPSRKPRRRKSRPSRVAETRRHLPAGRAASRRRFYRRPQAASAGIPAPRRPLVPRQQRFGQYTRSLMKALDIPVINQWGCARARQRHEGDRAAHRVSGH